VQLDINTQFALFFNEKRPFFLEGSDFFSAPLQVVYTRTLADPSVGLKTTGRLGDSTVGVILAEDEVTNLIIPGPQGSDLVSLDQSNRAGVFRYRHNIGKTSSVGAMLTTRDGDDYSNRVFGADGTFRVTEQDTIIGQILGSQTEYPAVIVADYEQKPEMNDIAGRIQYRHNSKHWYWGGRYEHIGDDFRADSGFIPQVGYRYTNAGVENVAYGEKGKNWYTRRWIGGDVDYSTEQDGELLERELEAWMAFQGPMQSFMQIVVGDRNRRYNDVNFDEQFLHWNFELQPKGGLYLEFFGTFADQIDFANTQLGERLRYGTSLGWNIGQRTKLNFDYSYEDLDVEGGKLFSADVTEIKAVYQFNVRMFVRAILQYTDITRDPLLYQYDTVDARSKRLFPQLLFSYKLNPQTVFFAGYSGTRLGGDFEDEHNVSLKEEDRTFFVKLGYAFLF
jgi:hypothetical protein